MASPLRLNSASLNMVRPELVRLVKQAQGVYEGWQQQDAAIDALDSSRQTLRQVDGVLRFIELSDAALLAAELAQVLETDRRSDDTASAAVTRAFLLLARYLDYLTNRRQPAPELLLDQINTLRCLRQQPALPESHFCTVFDGSVVCPGVSLIPDTVHAQDLLRKLRHLYQVGLVGAIRGRSDPIHIRLMQRACDRVYRLFGGGPKAEFWWLLDGVLEGLASGQLRGSAARNRLLGKADRRLKELAKPGALAEIAALDAPIRMEMLFLISKCRAGKRIAEVRALFGMGEDSAHSDPQLEEQRKQLQGPSMDAIDSLAKTVREELQPVKDTLEQLPAGADTHALADVPPRLARITPLLRNADLHAAADALEQQSTRVQAWLQAGGSVDPHLLSEIVEAVLFVEASLGGLVRSRGMMSDSGDEEPGEATRVMARSTLEEARQLMLSGAREAIEEVKRDVSAFVESGYDPATLATAEKQLSIVKGALAILEHRHAAAVAGATASALASALARGIAEAARDALTEALADVLICLEYYMAALGNGEDPDPIMLRLADESLAILRR